jgi:hypothetical protein
MGWWEWVFSGIGVSALKDWIRGNPKQSGASLNAQGAKVVDSPVASGSNITQNINSPIINLSLPTPMSGTPAHDRYREWRETIDEIHESIDKMRYAFVAFKVHDELTDYQAGIHRGNRILRNRILIAAAVEESGLLNDWDELVQYTHAARGPRDRWEQGSPTMGGFDMKTRAFQEKLMRIAREDVAAFPSGNPNTNEKSSKDSKGQYDVEVVHSISRTMDREHGEEQFDEHRSVTVRKPNFYNFDGNPGPIALSRMQHSGEGPWMDVWGEVTIVNPTQSHMKISLHRLVLGGKEWAVQGFFFRPMSNPSQKLQRISLMGNSKEHHEVHVMFPDNDYPTPPARDGELWVSTNDRDAFPVEVRCP